MNFEAFKKWLVEKGAEILTNTNRYEVIRFRANNEIGVVYHGKRGHSYTGQAEEACRCFKKNLPWRGWNKTQRAYSIEVRSLFERDGNCCFYCFKPMSDDEITREHLLSLTHGGSNHISNLVLCHRTCNIEAGALSLREKIAIREKNLLERK